MKASNQKFKLSALSLAITAAMFGVSAYAQEDDAAALKKPVNTMEVGVINVDNSSARFGEYNGLNKNQPNVEASFNLRGGTAYDNLESGGTQRWSLIGRDLGLSSRNLSGTMSNQGHWTFNAGYDELTHNLSDSYKTPYLGSMGANSFVLPSSYTSTPLMTNTNTTAASGGMNAAQVAALHEMDIATTRKTTTLGGSIVVDPRWTLNMDFNHLDQSGAKLQGVPGMTINGVNGESIAVLPMPTNYTTDSITVGVNWKGDKSRFNASYYGSTFNDANSSLQFQTYLGAITTQNMTTAPSNQFHQLNAGGGYDISDVTKLVANVSYGKNTQDSKFVVDSGMFQAGASLPVSSLGGVVLNTHADVKLTNQTTSKLVLSGGVRFDERENQTGSNIYAFKAVDGGSNDPYPNTPLSTMKTQYQVAGDYRIKAGHSFRAELDHEEVNRWCENYAVNTVYAAGTNCVVAKHSSEDKLDTAYKLKLTDDVDLKLGYMFSRRMTDSDLLARASIVGTNGIALPVATVPANSYGLNAGDYRGFDPFFDASRTEQALRAGSNWQVTDKLGLSASAKYTDDAYDSAYGVKNGSSWSANLDATFAYAEKGTVFGYLTEQHRQRDLTDISADKTTATTATPTVLYVPQFATWTNKLTDDDITVGFGAKQGGLMGGKLELTGDLAYTLGTTQYGTRFNYASVNSTGTLTCASAVFMSCGNLPAITSQTTQLKLSGTYDLDKKSKIVVRYVYQILSASDYYYNMYQVGDNPSKTLPTNQQVGNYENNAIAIGYTYIF